MSVTLPSSAVESRCIESVTTGTGVPAGSTVATASLSPAVGESMAIASVATTAIRARTMAPERSRFRLILRP